MNANIYFIGEKMPFDFGKIDTIESIVNYSLPECYKNFLMNYGYGDLNELLLFDIPDEHFMKHNFSDCLDLWKWDESLQQRALEGVKIFGSIDGDVILATSDIENPYLLLPRHEEFPKLFADFWKVIDWYSDDYKLKRLYFDSYYQSEWQLFNIDEDFLDLKLEKIAILYRNFKKNYAIDAIFNEENYCPKCVLQNIGGWVCFNLDNGNIRLKFQKLFYKKANEIIEFLDTFAKKQD